jgi:hypothetical protein
VKLAGRHLRFLWPLPWFTRSRLLFIGRRNTLQLLETALVVEGYRMRFYFPLIGTFFRQPLSEWTTVTIPYSRIRRVKHASGLLLRVLIVLLLGSSLVNTILAGLDPSARGNAAFLNGVGVTAVFTVGALLVTVAALWLLPPRTSLWVRQADGQTALLVFLVRSRKYRKAFQEQLRLLLEAAKKGSRS